MSDRAYDLRIVPYEYYVCLLKDNYQFDQYPQFGEAGEPPSLHSSICFASSNLLLLTIILHPRPCVRICHACPCIYPHSSLSIPSDPQFHLISPTRVLIGDYSAQMLPEAEENPHPGKVLKNSFAGQTMAMGL